MLGEESGRDGSRGEESTPRKVDTSSGAPTAPTDAVLGGGATLGPRDRATYTELARLDPRIAGLFVSGHQLVAQVQTDPSAVYLLAHAGRELSRGVVRALLGDEAPESRADGEELPETESNRRTIGAVLGQESMHASVTAWFRLNETFSRSCHLNVNVPPPEAKKVAEAFIAFSELLYGRVAPYFATAVELDALIAIAAPTPEDVTRLETLLTRVQQRRYFFSKLEHAGWVTPLAARGHFANPPERIIHADGSWQMRAWPQGEYLARVAPHAPRVVAEQLMLIPVTLANPAVWGVVTDAALAVPVDLAARLASRIAKALATVPPVLLPHKAVDLVKRLADERDGAAWKLAEALLWCRPEGEAGTFAEVAAAGRSGDARLASAAFSRVEPYELSRFCKEALPALQRLDAERVLKLLAGRLEYVLRFVRACVQTDAADDHTSQWWCESLEASGDDDVRAELASATARVAVALAETGPAGAQSAWAQLQRRTGDIFERIKLWVLARAGEHLPNELDAVIGGDALLDPTFGAREAAALLRARFRHASPAARAVFRYALERGPSADELRSSIEWRRQFSVSSEGEASTLRGVGAAKPADEPAPQMAEPHREPPPTKAEIDAAVRTWQARRLRWFHDRLPEELRDLAQRAAVDPQVPTHEQQSLDEVGFYSSGVTSWSGPESPKSADELGAMEPLAVVTLLEKWRPEEVGRGTFAYGGLEEALNAFARAHPSSATEVLSLAAARPVRPGYLAALLSGMRASAADGRELPWTAALRGAEEVVRAADRVLARADEGATAGADGLPTRIEEHRAWGFAVRAVADFVQAGCAHDRPPRDASADVWSVVGALVRSPTTWADKSTVGGAVGFERALINALNTASGESARALVDAGLWEYRAHQRSLGDASAEERHLPQVEALMAPLLYELLKHEGEPAQAVETMLGQLVPQLMLLAPDWFAAAEERLFDGGAENPLLFPAWGAYLLRARIYERTFRKLRRWYVRAAVEVPDTPAVPWEAAKNARSRDEWSVTYGLASHVLSAVIGGLASVGDEDLLVETTFTRVQARERARVYWEVYRGWSNAAQAPQAGCAERVLRFWEWRLTVLEAAAASPARNEEAEGLVWFLKTPHLPASEVIRLGRRTLQLCSSGEHASAGAWRRLRTLADVDTAGTFDLVELLVERELAGAHAYLPYDEVAPLLRAALGCSEANVRERAERLVHRLGEVAGRHEFGQLLSGGDESGDDTE